MTETVRAGPGALPRPLDSGYRGADYDFISARDAAGEERRSARSPTRSTPSARAPRCARRPTQSRLLRSWSPARRTTAATTRRSAARCSSCWCRREWSRFSAARPRCRSSSTAAPRAFRGSCSTATRPEAADRGPGRSARSCCASCAPPIFAANVADASADASVARHRRAGLRPEALSAAARRARRSAGGRAECLDGTAALGAGSCHRAREPRRLRSGSAPMRGPSSTRCSSATGASCTSPGMARRRR